MSLRSLHLELVDDDPSYSWIHQKDSSEDTGKEGTYMNSEFGMPKIEEYDLSCIMIDCRNNIPSAADLNKIDFNHKAVLLFTGNLENKEYSTRDYIKATPEVPFSVIEAIVAHNPHFILIDAAGIDKHHEARKKAEKYCAENNCYIINNVNLSADLLKSIREVKIEIDETFDSRFKPCKIYTEVYDL